MIALVVRALAEVAPELVELGVRVVFWERRVRKVARVARHTVHVATLGAIEDAEQAAEDRGSTVLAGGEEDDLEEDEIDEYLTGGG